MQIINDTTVVINNSEELKQVLSEENNYNYVYLGNDITMTSGFIINNNKNSIIIDGTYNNVNGLINCNVSAVKAQIIVVCKTPFFS